MIPEQLDTIFIECSWPSGRADAELYGHLTPDYLVQELETLAVEVVKSRELDRKASFSHKTSSLPARKKLKRDTTSPDYLLGALRGLRVYVMHCKDDMYSLDKRPTHNVIMEQVTQLLTQKSFGVEILHAEQGMRIGERSHLA